MINVNQLKKGFINGNVLKLIALITMTIDHVGYMLFPSVEWLRIVGRIAMPLYAYMIAQGCKYTKNKLKHFLLIFGLGLLCQIVYFVSDRSLYMGILIVFSFSIAIIYSIQFAFKSKKWYAYLLVLFSIGVSALAVYVLPTFEGLEALYFDYGFFGIMLPVIVYLIDAIFKNKWITLLATAIGLVTIALESWAVQWWSFLSLIPLALYNGQKGKLNLKYAFYIYYPLHLLILYAIAFFR